MEYKYTGIILGKYDIGESDRLYLIYTLEGGKIQAKAVGVRKLGAKLAGFLENFVLADLSIVKKNGTGKVTASIVENNFPNLKSDLDTIVLASRTIKIFDKMVGLGQKDKKLFELLLDYLIAMDAAAGRPSRAEVISAGFLFQMLKFSGYGLNLERCIGCGRKIDNPKNYFSLEKGGILCLACSNPQDKNVPISANGIKILRVVSHNKIRSLSKLKVDKKEAEQARKITEAFCRQAIS